MSGTPVIKVATGYVVWDDALGVFVCTDEGAFVWDQYEDAASQCREDRKDRPRRVEIILVDEGEKIERNDSTGTT